MTNKSIEESQPLMGEFPFHYQQQQDDEIDLRELWGVLAAQKLTVLKVTVLMTIAAISYAFLTPPIYKAGSILRLPAAAQVEPLNISGIQSTSPEQVFDMFKRNLSSQLPRRQLFNEMNLMKVLSDKAQDENLVFSEFNENIIYATPKEKKDIETTVTAEISLSGRDPEMISDFVNKLVKFSSDLTKSELASAVEAKLFIKQADLRRDINLLKELILMQKQDKITQLTQADDLEKIKISDEIKASRESAKNKRNDRIVVLNEAAIIAHSLGILDNPSISYAKKSSVYTQVNGQAQPLYMLGEKALKSEIQQLTLRTSDDPFIPELRVLQKKLLLLEHNREIEMLKVRANDDAYIGSLRDKENELSKLSTIHLDPNSFSVMAVDQEAYPSYKHIKPKRLLIIVVGFILGLMMGIFTAFFVNFISNTTKEVK